MGDRSCTTALMGPCRSKQEFVIVENELLLFTVNKSQYAFAYWLLENFSEVMQPKQFLMNTC